MVHRGIGAVAVVAAALVEEGFVTEEADAEALTTPCGSHQRDVDEEVGRSDPFVAVANEGQYIHSVLVPRRKLVHFVPTG